MQVVFIVVGAIAVLLIIAMLIISITLMHLMVQPKRFTYESCIAQETSRNVYKSIEELPKEEFVLSSFDGYDLHCMYVPAEDKNSNRFVIITHGHTYTMYGSVKYLHVFRDLGYNVIIYDNRGHGANKRVPVTMGLIEYKDLNELINYTYNRFGKNISIGLHGESMGSAISNILLGVRQDIDFLVSDCGYYDLYKFSKTCTREFFHLPEFLVPIADCACRIFYGFSFKDVSPVKNLENNMVPVCYIHGAKDNFINPESAKFMYETTKGYKEIHLFDGAIHAQSYQSNPELYRKVVREFLDKVM